MRNYDIMALAEAGKMDEYERELDKLEDVDLEVIILILSARLRHCR